MPINKDEFLKQLKKQLDDLNYSWNIERNKFEAKAQHLSADSRKAFEEQLEKLKKLQTEMKGKIGDLDAAGEHAWENLKEGAEEAWKALSTAIKKAGTHFKNKE
jgi:transketolase